MEPHCKITTERNAGDPAVTLVLNGKFGEESLLVLEQSIGEARLANPLVYLDLSEVTLVDRNLLRYILSQTQNGVTVVNCPTYLRRWITQDAG